MIIAYKRINSSCIKHVKRNKSCIFKTNIESLARCIAHFDTDDNQTDKWYIL